MTRAIRLGLLTSVWAASQAAAASPEGVRVTAAPVDGSSALWQGWDPEEDHQAMFVADGDKKTGWVEGADGDGAGEWIRLHVEPVAAVARVEVAVANGCQQSGASYRRYGRVKQATVTLQPGGASAVMALADDKDWQTQVIEQPAGPLTAVELRIDAVYPGSGGENTCLSEVAVHLPAAAAVDTAGEKARAAALREWVKARRALGKTFGRKKAKDPLPFAPRYVVRPDGGETALDCGTDQVCFIEEGLRALQRGLGDKAPAEIDRALAQMKETSGWAPVAVKVGDTRPVPPIDGLCSHEGLDGWPCTQGVELPAALGWLEAAQVQTTPVELIPSMRQLGDPQTCATYAVEEAVFARPRVGTPAALVRVQCERRDKGAKGAKGPARSAMQLLVYGADGRLAVSASEREAAVFRWSAAGDKAPARLIEARKLVLRTGERTVVEPFEAIE